ncbi:MAG: TonB-dependent receptor [Bacteroidetes bacterium]|nr:TonB-dependent receptor [Bacteroidota bacterium]
MIKKTLTLLSFFIINLAFAQKFTISGYVGDKKTQEKLIGAVVYDAYTKQNATTNNFGFFSLTLKSDSVQLIISYIGFAAQKKTFFLNENMSMNIDLVPNNNLKEIEIVAEETIEEKARMSTINIPIEQIKKIPAFLGEVDVLKVLQLLPGVKSSEGTTGLYVRGGGPDQNLILLDGAPIYNASHLFGFFSTFNADAIKNVELVKGGFPARYGGRLSSVIDINMKEGNMRRYNVEGSIGIVSSKIMIEGPIWKNKTSFIFTARRTYIDRFVSPIMRLASRGAYEAGYYFYDVNLKVNHKISDKDRIFLSAYNGLDKFYTTINGAASGGDISQSNSLKWGNTVGALRWNHVFNSRLFCNTSVTFTKYHFDIFAQIKDLAQDTKQTLNYFSGINDWAGNVNFDFIPSPNHYIRYGGRYTYHTFKTGANQYKTQGFDRDSNATFGNPDIYAHEIALYAEDDWKITDKFRVNAGLHGAAFFVQQNFYKSLQPRFSIRYMLPHNWSIKASYTNMMQFIHLLSNSTIGLPTDLWVPATKLIKPQRAYQGAAGFAKSLNKNMYELSIEGYYKEMRDIIDYLDGADFIGSSTDWQQKVAQGKGWSYGVEFLLQKKKGKYTGWIGYTLSWANRQFAEINFGKVYPYKYDRRHDLSVVNLYKISNKLDIGVTWVYGTGNAVSLPLQSYVAATNMPFMPTNQVQYYGGKNNYRMAPYHRLDFSINRHTKKKWGKVTWSAGLYNVYGRLNPYFLYFSTNEYKRTQLKQVSLFSVIPMVSWNFKFDFKNFKEIFKDDEELEEFEKEMEN